MKYKAFISYSHSQDSDLAPSIERALEQFAKPTFKRRALNIFRDANDLSASPDLWGKIENGLENSEYFIFMASPAAAKSKWCRKEIEFWKASKSMDNFLVVITDGTLSWNEQVSDFNWEKTNALPDNLSGMFNSEPLYVDFRGDENPEKLNLHDPDFKNKIVLLAATLHGRAVGDMVGEGVRQHRKTLRIRNGAIAVLSVLLIGASLLAYYAFQQKNIAETEKKEALRQANRALAKSYLADSKSMLNLDPTLSMKLAEYAYNFAKAEAMELSDFRDQLIASFNNAPYFYIDHSGFGFDTRAYRKFDTPQVRDGDSLYILGPTKLKMDKSNGQSILYEDTDWPIQSFNFLPNSDGAIATYLGMFVENTNQHLLVFDNRGRILADVYTLEPDLPPDIRIGNNGRRVLLSGYSQTVLVEMDGVLGSGSTFQLLKNKKITAFAISNDGNKVVLALHNGEMIVYEFEPDYLIKVNEWRLNGHNSEIITDLSFTENDEFLLTRSSSIARKWNLKAAKPYYKVENRPSYDVALMDAMDIEEDPRISYEYLNGQYSEIRYVHAEGDTVQFNVPETDAEITTSDGHLYANWNGLFNSRNQKLIDYSVVEAAGTRHAYFVIFSENQKFLFVDDRIYYLDPERIIERFNDTTQFGKIPPFSSLEKERYLILEE